VVGKWSAGGKALAASIARFASEMGELEHLQGTLQMNFAFGVVCKVPNSFAKSKNSPTPRNFAFRFGKPKV